MFRATWIPNIVLVFVQSDASSPVQAPALPRQHSFPAATIKRTSSLCSQRENGRAKLRPMRRPVLFNRLYSCRRLSGATATKRTSPLFSRRGNHVGRGRFHRATHAATSEHQPCSQAPSSQGQVDERAWERGCSECVLLLLAVNILSVSWLQTQQTSSLCFRRER